MLKNNKLLTNNGKIIKGIKLNNYVYNNNTVSNTSFTVSGVTENDPLYVYLHSNNNEKLYTISNDGLTSLSLSDAPNNISILTYGNENSVVGFGSNNSSSSNRLNGDIKGFLNNYKNLKRLNIRYSNFTENMDYYRWPSKLDRIQWENDTNISGRFETFQDLDNLETLILYQCGLTGDIKKYKKLKYLDVSSGLYGDLGEWDFINNVEYIRLYNNNFNGDISNWVFSDNLSYFEFYSSGINVEADVSNWDFSNTKIELFRLNNYPTTATNSKIEGILSGNIFPNTLESFESMNNGTSGFDCDLSSATGLTSFRITYTDLSSNISGITLPDSVEIFQVYLNTNLFGNINNFHIPSNLRTLILTSPTNTLTGNIINFVNNLPYNNIQTVNMGGSGDSGDISNLDISGFTQIISLSIGRIGITGTFDSSIDLPDTLNIFNISNNDIIIDLNNLVDTSILETINFSNLSGFTGTFSNLPLNNCKNLYLNGNDFSLNLDDLNINWEMISLLELSNITNNSDISNWFPSGQTTNNLINIQLYNNNITGNISNWNFNFQINATYNYLNLSNSNLYGDITSWSGNTLPKTIFDICNTDITGDVTKLDFVTSATRNINMCNTGMYGDLSGLTLPFSFYTLDISGTTGFTNADGFMDYIFDNRKNWTTAFVIDMQNIGDTLSGTYQLGDLGTYTGHEYDLTESEINNLVNGLDYDGNGTNTPWSSLEKYYYHLNATVSSTTTSKRYKINGINY